MTLRERQTELTRTAIVEAASDLLFGSDDVRDFTMQEVADRAGVSHRTIYRHFGSREELINAIGRSFDDRLGESDLPQTFEEWIGAVPWLVSFARTHDSIVRRGFLLGFATGSWRTDRDEHYWTLFRRRFPHLPEDVARQDFAALRHLYSAAATLQLGERFRLDAAGVAAALGRALDALVADIDHRDRQAAQEDA